MRTDDVTPAICSLVAGHLRSHEYSTPSNLAFWAKLELKVVEAALEQMRRSGAVEQLAGNRWRMLVQP